MKHKPRYVFDTNVIISALLFSTSTSGRALQKAFSQGEIILSDEVAEELGDVILRDRFERYVQRKLREESISWGCDFTTACILYSLNLLLIIMNKKGVQAMLVRLFCFLSQRFKVQVQHRRLRVG